MGSVAVDGVIGTNVVILVGIEVELLLLLLCCVCVFFPFILDIKFVGRTSRGHTGGRSQDFSSTFFLRCVPSFFLREGFSHSFPSSTVKSNFVY